MKNKYKLQREFVYKRDDMNDILMIKAQEFLVSHCKHRNFIEETIHPWRKDAKQIILHSFRVYSYAMQIADTEITKLSQQELLIIKLAAILHDIGKFYRNELHAQKSCEVVKKWLDRLELVSLEFDIERLLDIINGHSNKDAQDHDICSIILKDADTLDEIGAISIFMTSNWLDKTSPFFFHELSKRLQEYEIAFCEKNYKRLGTNYAREIMNRKKAFVENFIEQLDYELKGTEEFYELMGDL